MGCQFVCCVRECLLQPRPRTVALDVNYGGAHCGGQRAAHNTGAAGVNWRPSSAMHEKMRTNAVELPHEGSWVGEGIAALQEVYEGEGFPTIGASIGSGSLGWRARERSPGVTTIERSS